ncbi:MAG: ATP-binding protein [Bacteroidaceae bacterium]|nr:ATP-binding protein [Bacteroidaceae bacterium]
MRNRIHTSLALKLSHGILLMVIPIFFLSMGIFFLQSRRIVRLEATELACNMLNTTTQRVRNDMSMVETACKANEHRVWDDLRPEALQRLAQTIVRSNSHVYDCNIVIDSTASPLKEEAWYKTAQISNTACWVAPSEEEKTGEEHIFHYSKPLHYPDGRFAGVMATSLSLGQLTEAVSVSKRTYPNSYFFIIGEEGQFFVHPDSTRLLSQTIFSDADPHSQADYFALGYEMTAGKKGTMKVDINGADCRVCYEPVPGTPWSIAYVCPDSDILHSYHRLIYIIVMLVLIGLVVIVLLCYRIVSHAIDPINKLLTKLQLIADGHYDTHISHSDREDVIGRLQNSFALMLQSLYFHMGSIRYTAEQTERRNAELIEATRKAEEAVKQKTTFIQNMTHQIRTPLNIIMGFTQILRDSKMSDEEMKVVTEAMEHNSMTLNRMVTMLFDSSDTGASKELNSHKHDLVSCNDVAREAVAYSELNVPGIPVRFETALPDTFCIHTSELYLMRSLRELLYNAARYSDGKNVTMKITETEEAVRFIVEDTGTGMAEEYRALMFEPFTKVNDLSEGLGLGLSLAKRHAENLGGDLWLDESYDKGCRFILELPKYR